MSNPIRYDSLLVRHLVNELRKRLVGRFCASAPFFDSDRSASLELDRGEALELALHPLRGWIRIIPNAGAAGELPAQCVAVESPADERYFCIVLRSSDRFQVEERRLFVELHTNQWNLLVVEAGENRIVSALRARRAGGRILEPGAVYEPPEQKIARSGRDIISREKVWEIWQRVLADLAPEARRSAALNKLAFLGAINVDAVLGDSATTPGERPLREGFERWQSIVSASRSHPAVLNHPSGRQPYPFPLPGIPFIPMPSILHAMEEVADGSVVEGWRADSTMLRQIRRHVESAARRVESLRTELATAEDPEEARGRGDLLLAHLHHVPRGSESITLPGWEGDEIVIELDPVLTPAENADRWYVRARRSARAREQLPVLIRTAEEERERWAAAADAVERGEEPDWLGRELKRTIAPSKQGDDEPTLPYRTYRTSGGLEVRVGRNSKANDRLTFHSSKPDDIWLHARSVAGSHVILRWSESDAPPARDLAEAAGLAALFSKARTSSVVAVDWTRRKHVRKPRGAPAGAVIPQQVRTVFVEPNPALEERLRRR